MSDFEANIAATGDVMAAYQRLVNLGLAIDDPNTRGLNDDGMQTLTDLLAVLTFQTGGGASAAEQVCSATSRAMLSALADLYAEISGQPDGGAHTLQLLTAAVREARA